MAIVRVAVGSRAKVASGSFTPGEPSGAQQNDILICFAMQKDNIVSTMNAAYWTQIFGVNNGTTSRASAWWCRRGASAPDYLITRAVGSTGIAFVVAYRGCITSGSPIDAYGTQNTTPAGTTVTAPSVNTTKTNDMIIFTSHGAYSGSCGVFSGTNPAPTEYVDDTTNLGTRASMASDDGIKTDTGATGARTATHANSGLHIGSTVALKPAFVPSGWMKLQYLTEPPTSGAFNKLKFASEPPVAGAWNKLLYEGE